MKHNIGIGAETIELCKHDCNLKTAAQMSGSSGRYLLLVS